MTDDLRKLLDRRMATPFPDSVEKGSSYGSVDAVMIDADVYGWASRVASGERLGRAELAQLEEAARALADSLRAFPLPAQPYYEHVLRMARAALGDH